MTQETGIVTTSSAFEELANFNLTDAMSQELEGLSLSFERIKIPSAGSTRDYAHDTYHGLRAVGIHDRALGRLLELSRSDGAPGQESVAGSWCNGLEKG